MSPDQNCAHVNVNIYCDQDFEMNRELKLSVVFLLEEVLRDPDLLPQERKATANILRYPTINTIHTNMYNYIATSQKT